MTSHQRWINAKRDSSSTRVQEGRGGSPVPRPSLSSMTLLNIEPLSINTQTQSGPALPRSSPRGPRPGCALHITDYPSNLSLPVHEDSPPPPRHKKKKKRIYRHEASGSSGRDITALPHSSRPANQTFPPVWELRRGDKARGKGGG